VKYPCRVWVTQYIDVLTSELIATGNFKGPKTGTPLEQHVWARFGCELCVSVLRDGTQMHELASPYSETTYNAKRPGFTYLTGRNWVDVASAEACSCSTYGAESGRVVVNQY
jgi:hypothetical protein